MLHLQCNEVILWQSRAHPLCLVRGMLAAVAASALLGIAAYFGWHEAGIYAFSGAFILLSIALVFRWRSLTCCLTNLRLMQCEGAFGKKAITLDLDRIGDITCNQGILGRIFGYGTLIVQPMGTPEPLILRHISSPLDLAGRILGTAHGSHFTPCIRCGQRLDPIWSYCPFCGCEASEKQIRSTH